MIEHNLVVSPLLDAIDVYCEHIDCPWRGRVYFGRNIPFSWLSDIQQEHDETVRNANEQK